MTVSVDGSSTVFPLSEAVAEAFSERSAGRINVTVGESGTGGGFRKFCRGEVHITGASRPISAEEIEACANAGIEYIEIPVAFDAITVVVHPNNAIPSLTLQQLRNLWEPAAQGQVTNFRQLDPGFPDEQITLFGPGSASGTFDYFTEAVNGDSGASRTDYSPSEDDNVIVQGVTAHTGGLGYFGLAYYEANKARLRALAIDAGAGPVTPSAETVLNGTYTPLSRPIFIYVSADALQRPQVNQFSQFYAENAARLAANAGYVGLPDDASLVYVERLRNRESGTAFGGQQAIGATIEEIIARPLGGAAQ